MEKTVKALFIALLILFPLGQIGRVELGRGVTILLSDILVFLLVLAWFVWKRHSPTSFLKHKLAKPIMLFAALAFFSLLLQIGHLAPLEFFVSSLYLVRWLSYAGLYFVVSDFTNMFKQKILLGMLGVGTVTALLGLVQYFLYPDLRNLFYAGWDEHLYRLFSSLLDPNFAGGIFVLTFLLAISLLFKPRKASPFVAYLPPVGAVSSFVGILLTYSRGSFVSLVVGVITLFFLSKKKRVVFLLLAAFSIGILLLPKDLRGEGVRLFRTASIEARHESIERAFTIFWENPLFGIGFNAYRYAQKKHGFLPSDTWENIHSGGGTDNSFLFVLATTGIVGFLAYLNLWYQIVRTYAKNALILSSIAAIFVHSFFVNSLFYPQILVWLWILFGVSKVGKSL